MTFGETKALVIERFDRRWTRDGRLLRLPQEDCCQALSVPPSRKYQSDHGPGMVDILNFLKGSDSPADDQKLFLKAQILFWMIGATDGHAKNFSVFLRPGGSYSLTPSYDVLTAQPSLDARQIEPKQMKLAMSVGTNRHYRIDEIHARHFVQTADNAGLPKPVVGEAIAETAERTVSALDRIKATLPAGFPEQIHVSVKTAMTARLRTLNLSDVP
jgi:serine/threonine-protein kinase HipA